ncbi:hypothetical protein [uncultured Tateyamaria sp.]|uniref:hypothetical protein n=1 Tax=Tateyamaria sp. 1078 TaxID=3417464 RepID=UPI002622268D|nr:hypothetical protein [uncultured Tateyamaria sp.]
MTRALALIVSIAMQGGAAFGQVAHDQPVLSTYLGQQGCVIGPATAAQAKAEGFDAGQIAALSSRGQPLAGGHVLLAADICTITFPTVTGAPALTDPDVLRAFVSYDDGSGAVDPGCVLDRATFDDWMPLAKGWTEEETALAYGRMVAAGLISGDLRFYSDDILVTPPGLQLTSGRCAGLASAANLRATHDELVVWFDPFVRAVGPRTPCRNGVTFLDGDGFGVPNDLTGGTHKNAWLAFEIWLIAHGGGWYSFDGATDRGTPRPPACGSIP